MNGTGADRERLGRALRGGALAACLLALLALVGPRLASSSGGGGPSASVPSGTPGTTSVTAAVSSATTAARTTTTTVSPATTTSLAVTTSTEVTATTTATATTTPSLAPGPDEGEVSLEVVGLHEGRYGPTRSAFFAGDAIGWHFRVANTGGEYLWGVFVYLEGYGPVACGARRLEAGAATDCWAETVATPDQSAGEAWVTAWTALRMVTDRLSHRVLAPAA